MVEKASSNVFFGKSACLLIAAFLLSFVLFLELAPFSKAYAHSGICLSGSCNPATCNDTRVVIAAWHDNGRTYLTDYISARFIDYRNWLIGYPSGDAYQGFWRGNLLPAMMRMTEQLSAVGMHQMFAVGALMDAGIQLETQRDLQRLQVQALKDYYPSENYCWFGTNVRSISASEYAGRERKLTLNNMGLTRQVAMMNSAGAVSAELDKFTRWNLFVDENCMVYNNNWDQDNPTISGLQPLCGSSDPSERGNRDIHYGRYVDSVRTIDDINFLDTNATDMEKDIISLSRYLYGHEPPSRTIGFLLKDTVQKHVLNLRSVIAKRNVAQNSFNTIVGLKSPGTTTVAGTGTGSNTITKEFIASLIRDLGVSDIADIDDLIGEDPSYYAQMELLSKRIYQDSSFYANLYDKPENVARTTSAMNAIELMVDREIYESQLRREMLISVLLSSKLQRRYEEVQAGIRAIAKKE